MKLPSVVAFGCLIRHARKACGRPVETVTWDDANTFAQRLSEELENGVSFRLPTEAEWEYACRAGTETAIYTGNLEILGNANAPALDAIAWYGGNSGHQYDLGVTGSLEYDWLSNQHHPSKKGGTRKVGKKAANGWGLYDMLGNVWEWCDDWFASYDLSMNVDPVGPDKGSARVIRGGSWFNHARSIRSAYRYGLAPGNSGNDLGFRLLSSASTGNQ
jgi:formylglycine-generating enzyme required for sulfatase activity